MSKRLSYNYVKSYFEQEGYELLTTEYKNVEQYLTYKCPNGHINNITFHNFKNGNRCPDCSKTKNTKNTFEYIKNKVEQEGYKLLSKNYKNNRQKLELRCPNNHICYITYHDFNAGRRCKKCYNNRRGKIRLASFDYIKEEFEKRNYILLSDKSEYKGVHSKLKFICPNGHTGSMEWNNFQQGGSCSKCPTSISKSELEIYKFVKSYFPDTVSGDRKIIAPLELDIVIPEKKIAIEYCGLYWHSDIFRDKNYHLNKLNLSSKLGYRLITIFEDEWNIKKDIVKSRLLNIFDINTFNRVYARNCIIKEIDSSTKNKFLEDNHLQGKDNSSIKLGAFYNNDLVSVMTFSKPSIAKGIKDNKNSIYELNRFCSKINYTIIGIASKLLKYFIRNYNAKLIYSYADRRWSDGNLYKKLDFEFDHYTQPNYWYVKNNNYKRYHRFNFRKSELSNKLDEFDSNLTEYENMINNGYKCIWDCGNIKYSLKLR